MAPTLSFKRGNVPRASGLHVGAVPFHVPVSVQKRLESPTRFS